MFKKYILCVVLIIIVSTPVFASNESSKFLDREEDAIQTQKAQPFMDKATQSHIISFLEANGVLEPEDLLNLRDTSKSFKVFVDTFLSSQLKLITPDFNSFAPTVQRPTLGVDAQKSFNKYLPLLQKSLFKKLDTEGVFLVHKGSAARQALMTPQAEKALKLTETSLTVALEKHPNLYQTIYAQVFGTAFLDQESDDQWRNQSLLQHLVFSFMILKRTNQKNNQGNNFFFNILQYLASFFMVFERTDQDDALFFDKNIANIGEMLKSLKEQRSYVIFKDAKDNAKLLTNDSFLLMSDAELSDANNKAALEELLKTAPEANLILDAGQTFVDENGELFFLQHDLPDSYAHLTLTNARVNATTIGDCCLHTIKNFHIVFYHCRGTLFLNYVPKGIRIF